MTSKIDIYRSAKLLIDQRGEAAALEAAMEADAMLDKGDLEETAVSFANLWGHRVVAPAQTR